MKESQESNNRQTMVEFYVSVAGHARRILQQNVIKDLDVSNALEIETNKI